MKHSMKSDKSSKSSKKSKKTKLTPEQRKRLAKERAQAKKGDGSFPDTIFLVKDSADDEQNVFLAYDTNDMHGVHKNTNGAVYKLRRVADVIVNRKITR